MSEDNLNDVNSDFYNMSPRSSTGIPDFNAFDLLDQDILQHTISIANTTDQQQQTTQSQQQNQENQEQIEEEPAFLISDSLAKNSQQLLFAHLFSYLTNNGHYETAKTLFIENFEKDLQYLRVLNQDLEDSIKLSDNENFKNNENVEKKILTKDDFEKLNLIKFDPKKQISVNMLMKTEGSFLLEWWSILWDLHSSLLKNNTKHIPVPTPVAMPPPITRPQLIPRNSAKTAVTKLQNNGKSRARKASVGGTNSSAPSPRTDQASAAAAAVNITSPQQQLRLNQLQLQQQLLMQKHQLFLQQQSQQLIQNLKVKLQQQQQQQQQQHTMVAPSPGVNMMMGQQPPQANTMPLQQAQLLQQQQQQNQMLNMTLGVDKKLTLQNIQAELQYQQQQQKMLAGVLINGNPQQQEQAQWQFQQLQQQQNNLQMFMTNMMHQQHQQQQQQQQQDPQHIMGAPLPLQNPMVPNSAVQTPQLLFNMQINQNGKTELGNNNNSNDKTNDTGNGNTAKNDINGNKTTQKDEAVNQHNPNGTNYIMDYQLQLQMLENMQRQQIVKQQHNLMLPNMTEFNNTVPPLVMLGLDDLQDPLQMVQFLPQQQQQQLKFARQLQDMQQSPHNLSQQPFD